MGGMGEMKRSQEEGIVEEKGKEGIIRPIFKEFSTSLRGHWESKMLEMRNL